MKKILITVAVIVVGSVGWYMLSPLFIDKVVDEELVFDRNVRAPEPATEPITADEEPEHVLQEGETATKTTENDSPTGSPGAVDPDPGAESVVEETQPADDVKPPAPGTPMVLANGNFSGTDAFHKGSGEAYVVEVDGERILRFENFDVTNGPDLRVLLTTGEDPTSRDNLGEYIEIDKLKGNKGNQNYVLPDDVDIDDYNSVVIYCKPFHVVFARASLQ